MDIKSKQFAKSTTTNKSERIGIPPWLISDTHPKAKAKLLNLFQASEE